MIKKKLINKNDFDRVLITETIPFETPIIFSNTGLYDRIKYVQNCSEFEKKLLEKLILNEDIKPTRPYLYKIRKNSIEFRRLALIHPASQWAIRNFYKKYSNLIIYYCAKSPASIRSPKSIASSFYSSNSWENIYKYKNNELTIDSFDKFSKHAPTFFSYRGYDRLYKFFNSEDYLKLEKKFSYQATLDVSKCFDSIYTHSVTWATKSKEFIKPITHLSSFGDDFDNVIRHGNYNETNGIPIGPEVSRVFAEIIFQEIDRQVIDILSKEKILINHDYSLKRYVDDLYIFGKTENIINTIYSTYSDILMNYNLHTNSSKRTIQHRPFVSKKTRIISGANDLVNSFFNSFTEKNESEKLVPKQIYSELKITKKFIDSVKILCSYNEVTYDEITSYLIASITERVKQIIEIDQEIEYSNISQYLSAINVILETSFFLYNVSPSVNSSYKLSTTIILLIRFSKQNLNSAAEEVFLKIYDLSLQLISNELTNQQIKSIKGFVHLEIINILISITELGDTYLIPKELIDNIFIQKNEISYFTVLSCLFYIKNHQEYQSILEEIISYIKKSFLNIEDIFKDSEKAHLFLDCLSCPYIPTICKNELIKSISPLIDTIAPDSSELKKIVYSMQKFSWQIKWDNIDLLNSLEKKELKTMY